MKRTFILQPDPHPARANALQAVAEAPEGYVVTVAEPRKTRDQEEKYHAMFTDISRHVLHFGRKLPMKQWKRLLVEAFVFILREEAKGQGKPDPFPDEGCSLPSIDGLRVVQVEVLTRDLTKAQGSQLIEYLYAFGAEHDVQWTEPKAAKPQPRTKPKRERVDAETGEILEVTA